MTDETRGCSQPDCTQVVKNHAWAKIKADGWFFQRDGSLWCPEHVPDWVDAWRARKARA